MRFRNLFIFVAALNLTSVYGSHILGGDILIKSKGLECSFTIRLYTNDGSDIMGGDGILDFGDGNQFILPNAEGIKTETIAVSLYEFKVDHVYTTYGEYKVTYSEVSLLSSIVNMENSGLQRFFLDGNVVLRESSQAVNLGFEALKAFQFPIGNQYSLSNIVMATGEYHYTYQLADYSDNYENLIIPGDFKINNITGLMEWDTQFKGTFLTGPFLVFIRINQFDTDNNQLGYTTRAIPIVLVDHQSIPQIKSEPESKEVVLIIEKGNKKTLKVIYSDLKSVDELQLRMISNQELAGATTLLQYDSISQSESIKVAYLTITNDDITRDAPYYLAFRGVSSYGGSVFNKDIVFVINTKKMEVPNPVTATAEDQAQGGMYIYPNPFNNFIQIKGTEGRDTFIQIFQSNGQSLHSSMLKDETIDASQYAAGEYFIKIKTLGKSIGMKAIKLNR